VPDLSVIILTMGDRPGGLRSAIASARGQANVELEVVVVANGVAAGALDLEDVVVVETERNLGVPGGRNVGAAHAVGPLLAFLDDDARFVDEDALARCARLFRDHPRLGVVALRIVDEWGQTARRHVPRVGAGGADRSGPVAGFLGGAVVIRAAAFDDAGGYPGSFTYAMEESDLALRLVDRGWTIHYERGPAVFHPATDPGRHARAAEHTMRNRVWLAHRNLPAPVAVLYVLNWLSISALRDPGNAVSVLRAALAGWRTRQGPRAPIRWSTVARLTRRGRPPII
jgi:GT2 family glycosyltransferase